MNYCGNHETLEGLMNNHDQDAQKKILNRLRRAAGQLNAVITAVESGASCRDVVIQLAAVRSALDKAGFTIISTAMKDCLAEPDNSSEEGNTPEQLEKLFLMLT
jgi:DNA-binding FrmR family transcriptional regulator